MFSQDYVFTVVKVLTSTVNNNGQFQKISIPIPQTAFRISEGEGGSQLCNSEGMGGIYDWKSEGIGGFRRWYFWSRKC